MTTRKTSIEIDEELLNDAQAILKTNTIRDTVHEALMAVLRNRARLEEIEALKDMTGLDLDDSEVMEGAWRK